MLKKRYKSLDLLLASVYAQTKGQTDKAARLFIRAALHPEMERAWAELDQLQHVAHVVELAETKQQAQAKKPTLAEAMKQLAGYKAKYKALAKRRKIRADADVALDGEPAVEGDDALDLSAEVDQDEEVVGQDDGDGDLDDLNLDDDLSAADDDDDVEEMPEATAEAEDDDGEDAEEEEDSTAVVTARLKARSGMKTTARNLAAINRFAAIAKKAAKSATRK